MTDEFEEHPIDRLIAERKIAVAATAAKDAATSKRAAELARSVSDAFVEAQAALRIEIKKANDAIKRGGGREEFQYQPHPNVGPGVLVSAELILTSLGTAVSQYNQTVDAATGKIGVRSKSGPINHNLANALTVKGTDWADFLTSMYAGGTR